MNLNYYRYSLRYSLHSSLRHSLRSSLRSMSSKIKKKKYTIDLKPKGTMINNVFNTINLYKIKPKLEPKIIPPEPKLKIIKFKKLNLIKPN